MAVQQKPRYVEAKQLVPRSTDGVVPPFSVHAEESCVSAVLLDPRTIESMLLLRPEHFYLESNRVIWQTLLELNSRETPIDFVTVAERLKESGRLSHLPDGLRYLTSLIDACPVITNAETHAKIVITRVCSGHLDGVDNLASSLKNCIDGIAEGLCIDDKHFSREGIEKGKIAVHFRQTTPGKRKVRGVRIELFFGVAST